MTTYTSTAKILHWSIALMVFTLIAVGFYMTSQKLSPRVIEFYKAHKSFGLLVLALMFVRLAWRLRHRAPALPAMPAWQKTASQMTHIALYLLLFLMPLSGWLVNSATGTPMKWFGFWQVPALVARSPEWAAIGKQIHQFCALALCALIALHVLAALKHHFVERDGLLQRMWFSSKRH